MSKLKYTSSYDNNPNSDIGASKRVSKEYKKLLVKEKLKPIIQEMNNQTKSVVSNLNDYSLLLKTITQNLVNAELYLSNPEVSRSKGAGRYIGGGPKTRSTGTKSLTKEQPKTNKGTGGINKIKTAEQAYTYLHKKYKNKDADTRFIQEDKDLVTKFKLVKNIGKATKAGVIFQKIAKEKKEKEEEEEGEQVDEIPDEEVNLSEQHSGFKSPSPYGQNPLLSHTPSSLSSSKENTPSTPKIHIVPSTISKPKLKATDLDDYIEGARFSNHPELSAFQGGDPSQNMEEDEEEDDDEEEEDGNDNDEIEIVDDDLGYENYAVAGDGDSDNGDDNEGDNDGEGEDVTLTHLINGRENVHIRENFIITLFSNIINQVHKASDFWESNITPNLSDIPKLKMDSFMKSNAVLHFENAIKNFENTATRQTIITHLDYLGTIYNSLTNALDELFERMNIDIKRYSGGLSSSSDKPQLSGSGFLPFRRSVYSSHLRNSTTKYLM